MFATNSKRKSVTMKLKPYKKSIDNILSKQNEENEIKREKLTGKQNLALIIRQVDVLRVRRLSIVRQVDQYLVTFGKNYSKIVRKKSFPVKE